MKRELTPADAPRWERVFLRLFLSKDQMLEDGINGGEPVTMEVTLERAHEGQAHSCPCLQVRFREPFPQPYIFSIKLGKAVCSDCSRRVDGPAPARSVQFRNPDVSLLLPPHPALDPTVI